MPTLNYQYPQPVGRSNDWGGPIRAFIADVDTRLFAVDEALSRLAVYEQDVARLGTALKAHETATRGAHAASALSEAVSGDVQRAIDELRSQLAALRARLQKLLDMEYVANAGATN